MEKQLLQQEQTSISLLKNSSPFFKGKSDLEIWRMFKRGNEGAFNHIYASYFHELFRYGYRFTQERELIKDAIQDVFVELRQSSQRLSDTDSIRYYLYKVLRNKLKRLLSKQSRFVFQESNFGDFEVEFSYETQLINAQISEEQLAHLNRAMKKLTKREKEALFYFYYKGMSYEEVAGVMELTSVKSARNLIYKALKVLRKEVTLPSAVLLTLLSMGLFWA